MTKLLLILFLLGPLSLHARESRLQTNFINTLKFYKLGQYKKALLQLSQVRSSQTKVLAQKFYLSGLILNRQQFYEKSLVQFKKAISYQHKAKDLYYEYAQALLANNDLEISRRAFIRSYKNGFKVGSCLYYMAYISQLLNQPKLARAYYRKVLSSNTPQSALLQGSTFQIAEANLELGKKRKDTKKIIGKYVLPQLEKALVMNPTGTIASDIQQRILELQNEFDLNPYKLKNGRTVSSKKTTGYIFLKYANDNNITLSDPSTTTASDTQNSSSVRTIEAYINRRFIFFRRLLITPDLRWNFTGHGDSENSTVWQNNSYILNPTIRTLFEHSIFGRPASFILDFEHNYLAKALDAPGDRTKNSTTTTYNIGERFQYFNFGETTFKFSFLDTISKVSDSSSNKTTTTSIDQIAVFRSIHIFIFLYQHNANDFYNNTSETNTTNLFRMDYIYSKFWWDTQLQLGLAYTALTYEDATTVSERGEEATTTPNIKWSILLSKHYKLSLDYTYTSQSSTVESAQGGTNYTKSVYTLEFKYLF